MKFNTVITPVVCIGYLVVSSIMHTSSNHIKDTNSSNVQDTVIVNNQVYVRVR